MIMDSTSHSHRRPPIQRSCLPVAGPIGSALSRHLTPSGNRRGLTIVEVMISVMVFAVVLSAVASSWFSLRSLQRQTQDEAKVHELAQTLSERITGANWDWIGRDRPDELKNIVVVDDSVVPQTDPATTKTIEVTERYWRRYAWSWHRREWPRKAGATIRLPPLTDHDWSPEDYVRFRADTTARLTPDDVDQFDPAQPVDKRLNPHNLIDLGFIDRPTGLPNLQVYVEYYHAGMLDALFTEPLDSNIRTYFNSIVKGQANEEFIFTESPFPSDPPEIQMNTADQAITLQAIIVRIIVTWGDKPKDHRHELVMARRK
jgi:prepilin-type N-terminal cleavage/methylation domain-containing protein